MRRQALHSRRQIHNQSKFSFGGFSMSTSPKLTCQIVRPGGTYDGKQGFSYFEGLSAQSVGSQGICMHLLTIPPGGRAKAHLHENHETAIYVMSREAEMRYGEDFAEY